MSNDLSRLDCIDQAELVRRGELTPLELVEAAIARAEKHNPALNAIISPQYDRARKHAAATDLPAGRLRGVPILLKDLGAHLAGDPVYCGIRAVKEAGWIEPDETYFAGKLRRAGCISLGRTNTPELGLVPTTEPEAFGATRNPWAPDHSPGGSSGGSAAAVAAGIVPAAHASDGGGSIRIPAAHCGLVGLKPSRGRNSFGPDAGERWAGCSCEGFVTRSVRDTALLLDITQGAKPGDPYTAPPPARPYLEEVGADPGRLRIGLMEHAPRNIILDPACLTAVHAAGKLLASLGHDVENSYPPALDDSQALLDYVAIVSSGIARALDAWGDKIGRELTERDVEIVTWKVAQSGRERSAPDYIKAVDNQHAHGRRLASWWKDDGYDLLLTPTCAEPPPPLGSFAPTEDNPLAGYIRSAPFGVFTMQFNMSGQPGISLPLHWTEDGRPVGVQLVAAFGREDVLLRVAAQLEQAQPWADRLPTIHASN
ncbi:MAG: amidase [Deltaproteobacteria bacterium]|nr:MAG: amidase [Deltaproteobacteria bacterium]